jgi:hypothetical protein
MSKQPDDTRPWRLAFDAYVAAKMAHAFPALAAVKVSLFLAAGKDSWIVLATA